MSHHDFWPRAPAEREAELARCPEVRQAIPLLHNLVERRNPWHVNDGPAIHQPCELLLRYTEGLVCAAATSSSSSCWYRVRQCTRRLLSGVLRMSCPHNLCQHTDAVGFKHHLPCHGTAMRIVVAEPSYVPEFQTYENVVWKRRPLHVTSSARG